MDDLKTIFEPTSLKYWRKIQGKGTVMSTGTFSKGIYVMHLMRYSLLVFYKNSLFFRLVSNVVFE